MLALMLPCLGAWAAVTLPKVSTETEKHYYVIKSLRTGKYAYYNGDAAQLLQQTNPTPSTAEADLNKYLWYVTADGQNYKLHNVATTNIYAAYNSFTETGATVYIKENPHREGYVCVSTTEDLSSNCWDDQDEHKKIGNYNPRQNDNEGTSWSFIEVEKTTCNFTLVDNAENTYSGSYTGYKNLTIPATTGASSLTNLVWDNANLTANVTFAFPISKVDGATNWTYIKTRPISNYAAYFYVNNDGYVKFKTEQNTNLSYLPTADASEIAKYMWAIYPKYNSVEGKFTYNIKNLASNKYLPAAESTSSSIQMSETAGDYCWSIANSGYYGFHIPSNSNVFLNAGTSSKNEQAATLWNKTGNTNHQGVNLVFANPIYKATCNIADNAGGEYSWLTTINYTLDESDVERPASISGIFDEWITDVNWKNGACNLEVTFPFPVSNGEQLNATQIANFNATQKWNAVGTDVKVQTIGTPFSSEIATSLWGIYPAFENGTYTYKVKNVATQSWVTVNKNTNSFDVQGTVTLTNEGTKLDLIKWLDSPCFKLVGQTVYLTINGTNDTDVYLATWTGGNNSHSGNKLHFPKATYTVTVGTTGFASLYTPVAGTFAGEVKTYAIKETSADYASLTELNGVEANQGAIIEATPGTYTFTAGEVSSDWTGNKLTGSSVNSYVAGSAYVLALVDGQAALALAALNKDVDGNEGNSHFLNNAGKAYLPASAVTSNAQALRFNIGGTTGIEEAIVAPNANEAIYDLSGRRVMNAVKGGIYIKNGKKFIVK